MKRSAATMVTLMLASAMVGGQVVRTQSGRLLDANYGIGAGRYNSVRQADRPIDGNLLINQQVTGGYGFRGTVRYAGANELRLTLPSAGIDPFLRRSAGVEQLTRGTYGYGPEAYLSPTRTVLSPSAIASGYTRPGTSIPRSAYVPREQARQLISAAVEPYKPILADVSDHRRINAALDPKANAASTAGLTALRPGGPAELAAIRPTASTLFGVLGGRKEQQLVEELVGAGKGPPVPTGAELAEGEVTAQVEARPPGSEALTGRPAEAEPEAPPQPAEPARLLAPEEDIFIDILTLYQHMREKAPEPPARKTPAPAPAPETDLEPSEEDDSGAARDEHLRRLARRSVERMRDQVHVHSLAGRSKDQLNLHMTKAEKLLAAGKYYDAADSYQVATILDPSNPLPHVGAALAEFAANEPLSAAFSLRQGMLRFPPLMEIRVDVNRLLGEKMVAHRIGRLEARLQREGEKADPSLVFLATFIRHATGSRAEAVAHAKILQAMAPEDKVYRTYAGIVLTGKAPGAGKGIQLKGL